MGTYRILIPVLALAALTFAQQPQNNQFKLEGVVVNSATGNPVPRALVQVSGRAMLTGSEGDFAFDGLPAGTVQVLVAKPGYFAPGAPAMTLGWPSATVSLGPDTGKILVKLAPEAIITGRVANQDDEPVEGASVQVLKYTSVNDGPQQLMAPRAPVRSDEDGNFRIPGLSAGRYYVAVRAGNVTRSVLGAQTPQVNEAYPLLSFYPGTEELSAAVMVNLSPGQQMEMPFSLALRPAFKVAGTVVAPSEWQQVNAPIIVDSSGQPLLTGTFDPKTGAFEFRAVPAGTYTVRLSGTDEKKHMLFSSHKITISRAVADLKLSLRPGLDLPVAIHNEFTKPRPGGMNCAHSLPGGGIQRSDCSEFPVARVELIAVDAVGPRFTTDYEPMRDAGDLTVRGVLPGKYFVRAQAMMGGYVQSLRCGGSDLLREPLMVAEGGIAAPIEVVVRDDSAQLKVTVNGGKPGQSATVLLYPEGALLLSPTHRMTSVKETYFAPLAPGTYRVFAFDSIDGLDYPRSEAVAKYAAQATYISLAANGNSSVVVNVIHTGD
jgi:hypothetical protein